MKQKNTFKDQEYWQHRHDENKTMEAPGLKGVGKGNIYIYKILEEQYHKILKTIDIKSCKTFFDFGYGDGYFLKSLKNKYAWLEYFGIDISEKAKEKIDFLPEENLFVGDITEIDFNKKYDIVHSFDVLYHIVDDKQHYDSLVRLTEISNKYIILHERFFNRVNFISSRHVHFRRSEVTTQILNSKGFYLYREIPTHFLAMRILTFKLNKIFPKLMYLIEKLIAERLHPASQEFLGSHFIRIYKKEA